MTADTAIRRIAKPAVFALSLGPLAWLAWRASSHGLGFNPQEYLNRYLGDWALRFILIALAVTPLRGITGWAPLVRFRRLLGLFAFFYASLHLTSYVVLDQVFDWADIWADIVKRKFITVGMLTFLLLVPLALTSTAGMVKRLGAARWRRLHRIVYAAGALACLHYYMMVKGNQPEPLYHAAVLALLLGWRAAAAAKERLARRRRRLARAQAA
jgi:sulfoxide reductase heme-binding subunit YedZ